MKEKAFFVTFEVLSLKQIKKKFRRWELNFPHVNDNKMSCFDSWVPQIFFIGQCLISRGYFDLCNLKLFKSQRKTNYMRQNNVNSLGSLACVTMLGYNLTLVIIYSKSKLQVISDSSTFCISVVILHPNWWILLKCIK